MSLTNKAAPDSIRNAAWLYPECTHRRAFRIHIAYLVYGINIAKYFFSVYLSDFAEANTEFPSFTQAVGQVRMSQPAIGLEVKFESRKSSLNETHGMELKYFLRSTNTYVGESDYNWYHLYWGNPTESYSHASSDVWGEESAVYNLADLTDVTGRTSTLTAYNGPTVGVATSQLGGSRVFNGTSQYLECTSSNKFQYGIGQFSWGMWAKSTTSIRYEVGLYKYGSGYGFYGYKIDNSGNVWRAAVHNGDTLYADSALWNTAWTYYSFSRDNSGNVVFYINGISQDTGNTSQTVNNTGLLGIGRNNGSVGGYWLGEIEHVWLSPYSIISEGYDVLPYNSMANGANFWVWDTAGTQLKVGALPLLLAQV